jgi:hypothetical protein
LTRPSRPRDSTHVSTSPMSSRSSITFRIARSPSWLFVGAIRS